MFLLKTVRVLIGMTDLNEAFTKPLQNDHGMYKELTGDSTKDYVRIIGDLMERVFRLNRPEQINERYDRALNVADLSAFRRCAFDKERIKTKFERQLVRYIISKGFDIIGVDVPEGFPRAVYYELRDDYDRVAVGVGPYKHPVWLLNDESKQ